jgi:hypothetical protein
MTRPVSWLISNLQTAMLCEDDPVSRGLWWFIGTAVLVMLTVWGTRGFEAALQMMRG